MLILSIGAITLNLILGFGGMVSFGHAVYLGIGSYVVGNLGHYTPLRTVTLDGKRLHPYGNCSCRFCINSANYWSFFTAYSRILFHYDYARVCQMFYFIAVGNDNYGGDDGLSLYTRSEFHELWIFQMITPFTILTIHSWLFFLFFSPLNQFPFWHVNPRSKV
ncbi:MAG: hypothetical protein CM1200mP30_06990 [Pseudomonadota bacterium]|nr:MAG: hypothetical protein CM1200mP30_06990 [Pseudomonadota bacterium]